MCIYLEYVLAVGCWGGSSNHEKGQGWPCRGTCTVQPRWLTSPMCSGMGETGTATGGMRMRLGRSGRGVRKGGGRGKESKAVVGRATAQVASSSSSSSTKQASTCCSSSGSSSREVSQSGDELSVVPSPARTSAYPGVPGICWAAAVAAAGLGVCGWWVVGWSSPRLFIHLWLSVRLSVCPPY